MAPKRVNPKRGEPKERRPMTSDELADAERLTRHFERWKAADPQGTRSQATLAHQMNFQTQSAISQYLNGRIPLNLDALVKFAEIFECAPESISPRLAAQIQRFSEKYGFWPFSSAIPPERLRKLSERELGILEGVYLTQLGEIERSRKSAA